MARINCINNSLSKYDLILKCVEDYVDEYCYLIDKKKFIFNQYYWILSPDWRNLERQDVLNMMAIMMNRAGTITPSEMERIKWIENEINLNNLTSAKNSQFMATVNQASFYIITL